LWGQHYWFSRDFEDALAAAYIAEDGRVMASRRAIPGQVWMVFHRSQLPHWYVSTKVALLDCKGTVLGIAGAMYEIERPAEELHYFQELTPVIRHIGRNFADAVSMAEMAALASLSSTHFNRRFQQLLRMTPTGYLQSVRVQAACHLLSTTRRPLADIALGTGFSDQSHFTRRFRESIGLTPAVYRQRFQR
jgi:AraC-like DNA-binding protein